MTKKMARRILWSLVGIVVALITIAEWRFVAIVTVLCLIAVGIILLLDKAEYIDLGDDD